ncbi:asparaginase [uncultured Tateyamaria sp.]|uniref:asparaginase n=1 Tax=uncultured Tateyamaria sp. TaxID=455651 RepID=UPI002615F087|nr:asparaginase [uncultured Tateyamaria sp.]
MKDFAELAEIWRGGVLESRHWGVAAVANTQGEVIEGWGDVSTVTYPRSSMKPFQALPLIETGAADAYGLTSRHIALACASHRGEPHHIGMVEEWLGTLDYTSEALACGPEYPKHLETKHTMIANGVQPSSVHHNCSGKHTGFLSVCRHCGHSVEGYQHLEHPTQQAYAETLDQFDASVKDWGVDGCTLPTPALTIGDVARLGARFMVNKGPERRRKATKRLLAAMREHPEYASGTAHPMGEVITATKGQVVFKGGAEAFLLAFLEEDGLAVALKVADGNSRARLPALVAILNQLGVLDKDATALLASLGRPSIYDSRGGAIGHIQAADTLSKESDTTAAWLSDRTLEGRS